MTEEGLGQLGGALEADFCRGHQRFLREMDPLAVSSLRMAVDRYVQDLGGVAGLVATDGKVAGRLLRGQGPVRCSIDEACQRVVGDLLEESMAVLINQDVAKRTADLAAITADAGGPDLRTIAKAWLEVQDQHRLDSRLRQAGIALEAAVVKDPTGGWRALLGGIFGEVLVDIDHPGVALALAAGGGLGAKLPEYLLSGPTTPDRIAACVLAEHVQGLLSARGQAVAEDIVRVKSAGDP